MLQVEDRHPARMATASTSIRCPRRRCRRPARRAPSDVGGEKQFDGRRRGARIIGAVTAGSRTLSGSPCARALKLASRSSGAAAVMSKIFTTAVPWVPGRRCAAEYSRRRSVPGGSPGRPAGTAPARPDRNRRPPPRRPPRKCPDRACASSSTTIPPRGPISRPASRASFTSGRTPMAIMMTSASMVGAVFVQVELELFFPCAVRNPRRRRC